MEKLKQNILNIYGDSGLQWFNQLPDLITNIAQQYNLSHLQIMPNLSYHYVASAFQNNQAVILKLGLDISALKQEAAALKAFSGLGVPKLLLEQNGLLLQTQALPGTSLQSFFPKKEEEAIHITANIIKRLHHAVIDSHTPYSFPHIKDWLIILNQDWAIPMHYLQKARQLRDYLLSTSNDAVLLHGDLHHDNILQDGNNWMIIDPKGVIGDPVYEVAAFIRNPLPALLSQSDAKNLISSRITRFAAMLDYPQNRILDWCFVQAVLAWAWTLEDNGNETYFKKLTDIFAQAYKKD